jgi:hypothetical protein
MAPTRADATFATELPGPSHRVMRTAWIRPVLRTLSAMKAETGVNSDLDLNATYS